MRPYDEADIFTADRSILTLIRPQCANYLPKLSLGHGEDALPYGAEHVLPPFACNRRCQTVILDPMAKNPIPRGWPTCGRECWAENDQLIIKDWYKEHSSYTRETELEMTLLEMTLEDYIQKDNARRRVGEEWGCTVGGTDAMSQSLYDQDFYAWAKEQARAVHNKSWDKVDVEHLVEEIESLGSEQEHAVESHLANLLVHLLKWRYRPERRGKSWRQSILVARQRMARRLKRNPSLRPRLPFLLIDAYIDARALAASQTELPLDIFPDQCPWTVEQLQDPDFLPEE